MKASINTADTAAVKVFSMSEPRTVATSNTATPRAVDATPVPMTQRAGASQQAAPADAE